MPINRYSLRGKRMRPYFGITNNPKRRAQEHKTAGRRGKMVSHGWSKTRRAAKAWEKRIIRAHRGRVRNRTYSRRR